MEQQQKENRELHCVARCSSSRRVFTAMRKTKQVVAAARTNCCRHMMARRRESAGRKKTARNVISHELA
jgi:hypothetical protein